MSDKEYVEKVLSWRSDDFGHDTDALLRAESEALQKVGEMYLALRAERDKLRDELSILSESFNAKHEKLVELQAQTKRLRAALEKIVAGLSEKGPRQIAEEALK